MSTPTLSTKRSGFTLIEMLVVIAIIAILAGLLFPAIGRAMETAKRNKAGVEARAIAAAIDLFYNDYGYLPVPLAGQGYTPGPGNGNYGTEQTQPFPGAGARSTDTGQAWAVEARNIIRVLSNDTTGMSSEWANLNPKAKVYLNFEVTSTVRGEMLDPWDGQYAIKIDRDYNNMLEYYSNPQQHRVRAVVVSAGRDRLFAGSGATANAHKDNAANVNILN